MEIPLSRSFLERSECGELCPVLQINLIIRSPVLMLRQECVFGADNFAFEIGRKSWMIFGQAYQVLMSAHEFSVACIALS